MAFRHQIEARKDGVLLTPITERLARDDYIARQVVEIVQAHEEELSAQLPDLVANFGSSKDVRRRFKRIAGHPEREGYLVYERGRLVGSATLMLMKPLELPAPSAQLDFWIPDAVDRTQTGTTLGKLLIWRGLEVCTGETPHSWLFDKDRPFGDPSEELRGLMDPVGEQTVGYMPDDPNRNSAADAPARLYVARTTAE